MNLRQIYVWWRLLRFSIRLTSNGDSYAIYKGRRPYNYSVVKQKSNYTRIKYPTYINYYEALHDLYLSRFLFKEAEELRMRINNE